MLSKKFTICYYLFMINCKNLKCDSSPNQSHLNIQQVTVPYVLLAFLSVLQIKKNSIQVGIGMLTYCNAIVQNAMLLIVMAKANMLFYANKSTIFYFSTEWRPWEIKSNCSLYVVTVVPFILFLHPLWSYLLHKKQLS